MLGIYCRISQEKAQGKDRSINDQSKLGIDKAKELNLEYKVYIDEGFSGTLEKIEDRPEFSKLIDDVQDGLITAIYSYDQSRLERRPQMRFMLKKLFRDNDIKLYTNNGFVDLEDDESEMLGDIVSIMNEYYVKITRRKIKSVLHRNAKEGKAHSSIYPYGYTKDNNGFLVIDEEEAEVVKRIYKDSLNGIGTNKIAESLTSEGVLTRYNKIGKGVLRTKDKDSGKIRIIKKTDISWSGNTIRSIIKNSIYKGERSFGGSIYNSPIIIEPEYWQKVNVNLSKNRNNSGKKVEHKYLLKGLLECGVCGRNMYGRTRTNKKDHYYMCSSKRYKKLNCGNRSINIDFIEKFIWEKVLGDTFVTKDLKQNDNKDDVLNELNEKVLSFKKKIASLIEKIKKLDKLVIEDYFTIDEAKSKKQNLKSKIDDVRFKLKNTIDEIEFEKQTIELKKAIKFDAKKFTKNYPFNKKKGLISKYISRIIILYEEEIKMYFILINFKTETKLLPFAVPNNRSLIKKYIETGKYETTDEGLQLLEKFLEIKS